MSGCCDPSGYSDVFGGRFARMQLRRYRKKGLDRTASRMVDFLEREGGVRGASVLEIGGGIGDIQIELLRRGAAHATNLELVSEYDAAARQIAAEAGVADRMDRRIVDIAADPNAVPSADIVILHRVVCCYPDYERLLTAAAEHTRRLLVFSHPPRNPLSRFMSGTENSVMRLRRSSFRSYIHPPEDMVRVLEASGLRPAYHHPGRLWQVTGLTLAPEAAEAA